ncbi:MAG: hypothetical protein O2809_06270 [Proteobacteria bacterium]|nr:hypothetical protein [Pseudomonadota bacterium]
MKLKLKIQRTFRKHIELDGNLLTLPQHAPEIERYEDVTIYDPEKQFYVVAVNFHYSEDCYCGVYFYFDDEVKAVLAKASVDQAVNGNLDVLHIDGVSVIEVENFDDRRLPHHEVLHIDWKMKKKHKVINPFAKECLV